MLDVDQNLQQTKLRERRCLIAEGSPFSPPVASNTKRIEFAPPPDHLFTQIQRSSLELPAETLFFALRRGFTFSSSPWLGIGHSGQKHESCFCLKVKSELPQSEGGGW